MNKSDAIVRALVRAFEKDSNSNYAPADPRDFSTMTVFLDTDGYNSMRPLTFGEIADALVEEWDYDELG